MIKAEFLNGVPSYHYHAGQSMIVPARRFSTVVWKIIDPRHGGVLENEYPSLSDAIDAAIALDSEAIIHRLSGPQSSGGVEE